MSITNNGVFASTAIQVVLGDDGDGDGLPNDFEDLSPCLDAGVFDSDADADGDGLTSLEEFQLGTDPCDPDTDGDGINDGSENARGSNPLLADSDFDGVLDGNEPDGDLDGDGIPNFLDSDSDNDGLPDGVEFAISGSINGANPFVDSDGDGLLNIDEVALATDPLDPDSDDDGLPDGLEALKGTDALVADNTPPTIELLSPVAGVELVENDTISISIDAMDDGLVRDIDVVIDGVIFESIAVDEMMFQTTLEFQVPIDVASVEIGATAVDTNGNLTSTGVFEFAVIEDPLTTVVGTVFAEDGFPADGAAARVRVPAIAVETGIANLSQVPWTIDPITNIGVADVSGTIEYDPGIEPYLGDAIDFAPEGIFDVTGTITVDLTGFGPATPIPLDGTLDLTAVAESGFQMALQGTFEDFLPAPGLNAIAIDFDRASSDPTGTALDDQPLAIQFTGVVNVAIDPVTFDFLGAEFDGDLVGVSQPDFSAVTNASGDFAIPDVATIFGDVIVEGKLENGVVQRGTSTPTPAIRGGTTDVGTIDLSSAQFELDLGQNLFQSDDDFDFRPFASGFTFPFFGETYSGVFVNSNGRLTFSFGDRDFTESFFEFNQQPGIAALYDDLIGGGGVFVNMMPDRAIITWNAVQEYCCFGSNTAQVVLFPDGRIQIGYNGVDSADSIVGVTPGGALQPPEVDFTADVPFGSNAGEAIFEQFLGGGDSFDLDEQFLLLTPNGSGGFDVDILPLEP